MFTVDNTAQLNDGRVIIAGGEDYDFSQWDGMPYRWFSKTCLLSDIWTSVETREKIPPSYYLYQNYPNPFNPTTNISFQIPENGLVTLKVYDVLGREVALLVDEEKYSGEYEVKFDGSNLSSGVYFYRLTSGSNSTVKKMLLLR